MKILFLSELFYPHGGGAELATYLYAKLLSKTTFSVVVITNRFAGESEISRNGNFMVYRVPLFRETGSAKYSVLKRFDILFSSFMRKMIKRADVVYIPRFWYSAIPLAKIYGKPVITHIHDYFPICPLSNLYDVSDDAICDHNGPLCPPNCVYAYEKTHGRNLTENLTSIALNSTVGRYLGKVVKSSDAIICVSNAQRNIIANKAPSLRRKIKVIHNPLPRISPIDIEGDDFGYFGGLNYLKGFRTLCCAATQIKQVDHTSIHIHVTKFPTPSKHLAKSLKQVGFLLYGKLDNYQFERLYRQIRSVIVPSVWPEPWPYVVVEAIIQGRFVIASSVGGIPEQVKGCKGSLLCKPKDCQELIEAIKFLRSLKAETVTDLGLQNRETFLGRFDNETTLKKFIKTCEILR